MTRTKIAWITGASSGIGRAAAEELAKDGWQVALTARSEDELNQMSQDNDKFYPCPGDVTDQDAMQDIVENIEKNIGEIDLALLNAGTHIPDSLEKFSAAQFQTLFAVNVQGMANALEPVLERFRARGKGHVAIMASVAGYRGLPGALAYGASKAALINFAEGLAGESRGTGVKIQVINPGFVKTPLTDKNDFPMPMRISTDKAAQKLIKGLKSDQFEITFPWLFCALVKFLGWITPNRAYIWAISKIKDKRKSAQD